MRDLKVVAFEYVLYQLNNWYKIAYPTSEDNDISILKALKLLFFISAVNSKKDSGETLLDEVFNNFVAMPYGHVESDIYSIIKNKELLTTKIDNSRTSISEEFDPKSLDQNLRNKIDESIERLKSLNFDLIKYSPFDLVELSHAWYSWKYYFAKARRNHTYSESIPNEIIKSEDKIFFIF